MSTVTLNFSKVPAWKMMIRRAVDAGLTQGALTHKKLVSKSWTKGPRFGSSLPGQPPNMRRGNSGGLASGLVSTPGKNGRASSGVSKSIPYARILELGGTITPKRGKALPVPLNEQAKRISEKGIPLRTLDLIMLKPRGKAPILIGRKRIRVSHNPGGGRTVTRNVEPVWVLVPRVRIKARPYLVPRANDPSIATAVFAGADRYIRDFTRVALGGAR